MPSDNSENLKSPKPGGLQPQAAPTTSPRPLTDYDIDGPPFPSPEVEAAMCAVIRRLTAPMVDNT